MRFRLDLSYDGSNFRGWGAQPNLRTVQEEIEHALKLILRLDELPRLTVAGRTDSGVHARGQVAHVDLADDIDPQRLLWRLRNLLDPDIQMKDFRVAPAGFDARFSALQRRYIYRICDVPQGPDPLRRGHIYHHGKSLDPTAMNYASQHLLGEHDFASFCKPREGATTIRTLREISTVRGPDGTLETTFVADAFCHSMVRALMGALIVIGQAKYEPAWAGEILAAAVRQPHIEVMPAHGLTLEEVTYPPEHLVAHRAVESRRRRKPSRSGFRLAPLSQRWLAQIAAGDLEAARAESGLPLDRAFADEASTWSTCADLIGADIRNTGWSVNAVMSDGVSVGHAGFQRAPDLDGMVEILCTTFEPHRRRGLAREAVGALIEYARESEEVRVVRALVPPDDVASLGALTPHGFAWRHNVESPGSGVEEVWELRLQP